MSVSQLGMLSRGFMEGRGVSSLELARVIQVQGAVLEFLIAKGGEWNLATMELRRELECMNQTLRARRVGKPQ